MATIGAQDHRLAAGQGIRARLLGLLGVPLLVLGALTGTGLVRGVEQSRAAAAAGERTELALLAQSIAADLQVERAELIRSEQALPGVRARIRAEGAALVARADEVPAELAERVRAVGRRLEAAGLVADRGMGGPVAVRVHSEVVADLLALATAAIDPAGAFDDAAASVTDLLARAAAASTEERDLVTVLLQDGSLDARGFGEAMSLAAAQGAFLDLAAAQAPDGMARTIRQVAFANAAAGTARRTVFEGSPALTASWLGGLDRRSEEIRSVQGPASAAARQAVTDHAAAARALLLAAGLAALAIGLVTVLVLRRALRSIARPLQDLAVQAQDVARTRLPEAVQQYQQGGEQVRLPLLRAAGASEVAAVARAFNEVQDTALRLAGDQAAMRRNQSEALTNLGRRTQGLVARQLDYLSELEASETDPAFLEHLFRLDHLASRLRRNAESLLILSGTETPRRRREPVAVAELVRAAMGEVEGFERVRLGNLADAQVLGPATIDVVHLLAELLENALGFSSPDTTVEVDGRPLAQGGYQFAIIDHGLGMTDVELTAANRRLAGTDEVPGMPTRYLGQYVVAKLTARIGAMVRLQPTSGGRGVTAVVILPAQVVAGERDRSTIAAPLPGSRAARAAGPMPFAPGAAMEPVGPVVLDDLVAPEEIAAPQEVALPSELLVPDQVMSRQLPPEPTEDPWEAFVAAEAASVATRVIDTAGSDLGDGRVGGLVRRVPGATLNSAPVEGQGAAAGPPQRSATEVASMLSAIQAGRQRGRTAATTAATRTPAHHEGANDDGGHHDDD
jgi:signal transduction histidine kinase